MTEVLNRNMQENGYSSETNRLISGSFAAWLSLFVVCPVEVLKCKAQVSTSPDIFYRQIASKIIQKQGVSGLYCAYWPLFWREVPGWGVYFATYDYLKT